MKARVLKDILETIPDDAEVVLAKEWASNEVVVCDEWDAGTMIEGSPGPMMYVGVQGFDFEGVNCVVLLPAHPRGE